MIDLAVFALPCLSEQRTQSVHALRDAGNVVLLRNDEADDRFPQLLPQDAQATPRFDRRTQISIPLCDL